MNTSNRLRKIIRCLGRIIKFTLISSDEMKTPSVEIEME